MSDERFIQLLDAVTQLRQAVTDLETGIRLADEMERTYKMEPTATRLYIADHVAEFVPMARKMVTKISLARQEYAKRRRESR